jgi:hypothetical protein
MIGGCASGAPKSRAGKATIPAARRRRSGAMRRSPDEQQRNPGALIPACRSAHAGYDLLTHPRHPEALAKRASKGDGTESADRSPHERSDMRDVSPRISRSLNPGYELNIPVRPDPPFVDAHHNNLVPNIGISPDFLPASARHLLIYRDKIPAPL